MQNRKGNTLVTSVSISKEFSDIIKKYGLSATEMVRKGIAISLYELGEQKYQSETNKLRYEAISSFLKSDEIILKLNFLEEKIKEMKLSLSL